MLNYRQLRGVRDPFRHTVQRGARSERVRPTGGFREAKNQQNPLKPGVRGLPIPRTARPASPPRRSLGLAQIPTGHSRESRSSCRGLCLRINAAEFGNVNGMIFKESHAPVQTGIEHGLLCERRMSPRVGGAMSVSWASRWIRFLRNYGPTPTNDNMYDESIQRALRRHRIEPSFSYIAQSSAGSQVCRQDVPTELL